MRRTPTEAELRHDIENLAAIIAAGPRNAPWMADQLAVLMELKADLARLVKAEKQQP